MKKQQIITRTGIAIVGLVMALSVATTQAATVYTIDGIAGQGTGWDGTNIIAWDGIQQVTLTSDWEFSSGDVLEITVYRGLRWADFDGWNFSNLTINAGVERALESTKWGGATYSGTTISATDREIFRASQISPAFSGDLTGLTINKTGSFWRYGDDALDGSSFNGAVINISGGAALGFAGSPSVSFSGATIDWGGTRTFWATTVSNIDWSGVTLTINAGNFWRDAATGPVSTDWTDSTINAVGGGLFDAMNQNQMFNGQTFDFAGATLSGDLFAGLSQHELNNGGFTLDFMYADVGGILSSPDVASLDNFEIWYGRNTIFGDFTEQHAINANWTFIPEPSSLLLLAAGGLLLMRRRRR